MRPTFSKLLAEAARADERILLLTGDHGYALFDEFRQACPGQYINCGVAEQNMVGVAAGLAKAGFRPVVYGLSAFVPMRVLEQIKIDVCYESLPVVFVGDGAGVVYAQLGASHQSTEDIAALRAIPNIRIFSPSDRFELEYCWRWLLVGGPGYLRFGKADLGDIHAVVPKAPLGSLLKVRQGETNWGIIATGSMVSTAVKISDDLKNVPVWSAPFIEPLDKGQLVQIARSIGTLFVLEEHSDHGGLGSLIAEIVSEAGGARVVRFGTRYFSYLCGDYPYLMSKHGLGQAEIQAKILEKLAKQQ